MVRQGGSFGCYFRRYTFLQSGDELFIVVDCSIYFCLMIIVIC